MKCQILFPRKSKQNISNCCLLIFLLSMQSDKIIYLFLRNVATLDSALPYIPKN